MFGKRFWWRELPAFVIGTGMMALAVNMVYSPMGMVPGGLFRACYPAVAYAV